MLAEVPLAGLVFTGSSCRDATRELERALGVAGKESLLPEFYGQVSTGQQIQQGN